MSFPIPLKICGLGRYLPERVVTNAELEKRMGLSAGWIEKRTGVRERRWISSGMTASSMAARAAEEALRNAGLTMEDVSLIINASGICQRVIPDNAPLFQREMGYGSSGIPCISVHTTCLSFLSGIEVAAGLLNLGCYQNILLLTADVPSHGLNFRTPESASLFGDAAAAALLSLPGPSDSGAIHALRMETYGDKADLTTVNTGSERPPYTDLNSPEDALFHMDGKQVYRFVQQHAREFISAFIPDFSREMENVKAVVPHQVTMRGLNSLQHLGIDRDKMVITLPEFGNCVAASIPLTLYKAVHTGILNRGERFLILGSGAGLSLAGALLTF